MFELQGIETDSIVDISFSKQAEGAVELTQQGSEGNHKPQHNTRGANIKTSVEWVLHHGNEGGNEKREKEDRQFLRSLSR